MTSLFNSTYWLTDSYNSFLFIAYSFIKIIHYYFFKNNYLYVLVYWNLNKCNNIISQFFNINYNQKSSFFIFKCLLLFYYLLNIKRKVFTFFYSKINGQIERYKKIIKTYLWASILFKKKELNKVFLNSQVWI